jgi:diguanylate cyclase (GGDEF)-like protein
VSEFRGAEGARRLGFVLFAAVGVAFMGWAIAWPMLGSPSSWPVALAAVVTAAAVELCRVSVGSALHRTAVISVPIVALPVVASAGSPFAAIGLISLGVLVVRLVRVRRVPVAFYAAGLTAAGGLASVIVFAGARAMDVSSLVAWPLAALFYVAVVLAVELLRIRFTKSRRNPRDLRALSPSRLAVVASVCVVLAFGGAYFSERGLPYVTDTSRQLNAIVFLLGLALIAVVTKFVIRNIVMRRRLVGLISGASALSAARQTPAPTTHLTPEATAAKETAELCALLCDAVTGSIGGESVAVREYSARTGEISARITLGKGISRYVVARRDPMDVSFTTDDRIALRALAHATSIVVKARASIGGLTARANTDPLTGLPNYGAFQAALANINEHRDYSEALAVLFIDLDDFKRLNDRNGHKFGDDILKVLGKRLKNVVRPDDVVARVGGDEFVIILTHLSTLADAKESAERIMAAACAPLTIGSVTFSPVLSIGLAYSAHRETDVGQLVQDADRGMLAIKKSRRKGGRAKESSINISSHRSSQVNDIIARAIDEDRLELAFQPIVSLITGQIWAFEALVRYTDPDLGAVSPSSLVEKAKGLGRLDKLTRQVAEKAMAAAAEFRLVEKRIVCMTINVEAAQIVPERVGSFVANLAGRHPGISLCLELNERSVARVSPAVRAQAEHLRGIGLLIALDDYGSQDSSVDSLVRVPMDILKIDRSLVDDLDDVRQREVLLALQGFGDSLEYSMIVEGVESASMARHLRAIGVRNAQGFHYGIPQSFEGTLARLEEFGADAVLPASASTPTGTFRAMAMTAPATPSNP